MRIQMKGAPHRYHEDDMAGKVMDSLSRYNLVHKNVKNWRKYRHGI